MRERQLVPTRASPSGFLTICLATVQYHTCKGISLQATPVCRWWLAGGLAHQHCSPGPPLTA